MIRPGERMQRKARRTRIRKTFGNRTESGIRSIKKGRTLMMRKVARTLDVMEQFKKPYDCRECGPFGIGGRRNGYFYCIQS